MYEIKDHTIDSLKVNGVPNNVLDKLNPIIDNVIIGEKRLKKVLETYLSEKQFSLYSNTILFQSLISKSP